MLYLRFKVFLINILKTMDLNQKTYYDSEKELAGKKANKARKYIPCNCNNWRKMK